MPLQRRQRLPQRLQAFTFRHRSRRASSNTSNGERTRSRRSRPSSSTRRTSTSHLHRNSGTLACSRVTSSKLPRSRLMAQRELMPRTRLLPPRRRKQAPHKQANPRPGRKLSSRTSWGTSWDRTSKNSSKSRESPALARRGKTTRPAPSTPPIRPSTTISRHRLLLPPLTITTRPTPHSRRPPNCTHLPHHHRRPTAPTLGPHRQQRESAVSRLCLRDRMAGARRT